MMFNVAVAGLEPGVTDAGLKTKEVLPGNPLTVKSIGLVNALFVGVTVMPYFAGCPALAVMEGGETAKVKSGGLVIVVTSIAVSLAVLISPPPATTTTLVTLAAALAATLTVRVIAG
jgi:hypothetical protein